MCVSWNFSKKCYYIVTMPFDASAAHQTVLEPKQILARAREVKTAYIKKVFGPPLPQETGTTFAEQVHGTIGRAGQPVRQPRAGLKEQEVYFRDNQEKRRTEIKIYRHPQSASSDALTDVVTVETFEKPEDFLDLHKKTAWNKVDSLEIYLGDPAARESPRIGLKEAERLALLDQLQKEGVDAKALQLEIIRMSKKGTPEPLLEYRELCERDSDLIKTAERIIRSSTPISYEDFY